MAVPKVAWVCLAVALQGVIYMVSLCAGQGFIQSESRVVGATDSYAQLKALYSNSKSWQRSYKAAPSTACSSARSSSLCAAAAVGSVDAYAQLMVATSPAVYSSDDPSNTGPVRLVAAPLHQQGCDTCSAFAVAAAAETAMSSALRVDVTECSISVQALHFCPPNKQPGRSCRGGYSLSSTIALLQQTIGALPTDACLPYKPDLRGELSQAELCTGKCNAHSTYAGQGSFSSSQITSMWEAQRHIRLHGAVVSRFDIYDDFKPFFASYGNARAIYKPKSGAKFVGGHAVVLVGYDNDQQFWLVRNSWGTNWADGGFFRVAYGTCSVLTAETGEAYGLVWTPQKQPDATKLKVTPGPRAGCYLYKALRGDYMSRVAWLAGIPLDRFMMDNVEYVKDLDASLEGVTLLVCSPKPGRFVAPSTSPPPVPSTSVTTDPQLEALLRIKSSIDKTNQLKEWTRESGAKGGYCKWKAVNCDWGMVTWVEVYFPTAGSGLQGSLPPASAFAGLTQLMRLDLADQPGIYGTLPSDWPQLKQLEDIRVANNSVTGTMPADWAKFGSRLKVLHLWGNKLTGRIPDAYKVLTALDEFWVSDNQLTGTILAWLGGLSKLNQLVLYTNRLRGTIPDSLKGLSALNVFSVSTNQLTGTIPAWLGDLSRLKLLYLYQNMFTGTMPHSLKGLSALTELDLSRNQLTGTLPGVFGELTKLELLQVGVNKLTGTLPDQYKALVALETLGVEVNSLVGTVPASWAGMARLKNVWLNENSALKGCLPKVWSGKIDLGPYGINGTKISGFC